MFDLLVKSAGTSAGELVSLLLTVTLIEAPHLQQAASVVVSADQEARAAGLVKRILGAQGIEHQQTLGNIDEPNGVAWAADGSILIAGGAQGLMRITTEGARRVVVPAVDAADSVDAVAVAADGRIAIVRSHRNAVELLNSDFTPLQTFAAAVIELRSPRGVCFTDRGIAIADTGNNQVVMLASDEVNGLADCAAKFIRSAGGLELRAPESVTWIAQPPSLVIADTGNHRIVVMGGDEVATFGARGPFAGQFCFPTSVVSCGDRLWIADRMNHRIVSASHDGGGQIAYGLHSVRPREGGGSVHYPTALAVRAHSGNETETQIAVCEPFERRVQILVTREPSREVVPPLGTKLGVSSHFGRGIDVAGDLLVAWEPEAEALVLFDCSLDVPEHITTIGSGGNALDRFGRIDAVCLSGESVIVADGINRRISQWDLLRDRGSDPKFDPFMGVLRSTRSYASIETALGGSVQVRDMARAADGALALLDTLGRRIIWLDAQLRPIRMQAIESANARSISVADDGAVGVVDAVGPRLWLSSGVSHDLSPVIRKAGGVESCSDGSWLVTDALGDAVVRIARPLPGTSEGVITAIGAGGTGDGDGQFHSPSDAATDSAGNIYVLDMGNHRMQRFDATGAWQSTFTLSRSKLRPRVAVEVPAGVEVSSHAPAPPADVRVLQHGMEAQARDGSFFVRLRAPSEVKLGEPFTLQIEVRGEGEAVWSSAEGAGNPGNAQTWSGLAAAVKLSVDASMPHHGHGMNIEPAVRRVSEHRWVAEGLLLHMPGMWIITLDLGEGGVTSRAQVALNIEATP